MKKIVSSVIIVSSLLVTNAYAGACYITVSFPSGNPHSGIKVVGSVKWGGVTSPIRTDSDGRATITWHGDNKLTHVYIDGRDKNTTCRDGGSLSFVVD